MRRIAMCGADCETCEAYRATRAEDQAEKERIAAQWREEYHAPDITAAHVTCDGCLSGERHGGYCGACAVRACGVERGMRNCAFCEDYEGCATLGGFFSQFPGGAEQCPSKIRLDGVRRTLDMEQGS